MQRLTKYPLLLEGILKATTVEISPRDYQLLPDCIQLCRGALDHVNQKVHEHENRRFLQNIAKNLEVSKEMDRMPKPVVNIVRNIDLPRRELLHNGELQWRQRSGKTVTVEVLLFRDLLILLERSEDKSRYYLRPREECSPILILNESLPPREVATDKDKKAFYLVCVGSNGPKMYELVASRPDVSQVWQTKAEEAIKAANTAKMRKKSVKKIRGNSSASMTSGSPSHNLTRGSRQATVPAATYKRVFNSSKSSNNSTTSFDSSIAEVDSVTDMADAGSETDSLKTAEFSQKDEEVESTDLSRDGECRSWLLHISVFFSPIDVTRKSFCS